MNNNLLIVFAIFGAIVMTCEGTGATSCFRGAGTCHRSCPDGQLEIRGVVCPPSLRCCGAPIEPSKCSNEHTLCKKDNYCKGQGAFMRLPMDCGEPMGSITAKCCIE